MILYRSKEINIVCLIKIDLKVDDYCYCFEKNNFPRKLDHFFRCQNYFKLRGQNVIFVKEIVKLYKTNRREIDAIVKWNKGNTRINVIHFYHRKFLLEQNSHLEYFTSEKWFNWILRSKENLAVYIWLTLYSLKAKVL